MVRKSTISYGPSVTKSGLARSITTDWYLTTNTDVMQFYCFNVPQDAESAMTYTLIDMLDRTRLTAAGDNATAKNWARRLGLKNWTYVRV